MTDASDMPQAKPPDDGTRRTTARRLAQGVSFYMVARSAAGAIRVLSVPLIVHAVSASTFGTLATLWVPLMVVHGLCDLGLGTGAIRFAPECRSPVERRSLFATAISTRALVGVLVTAIIVSVREPLARWITGSPGNGDVLLWLALSRPVAVVCDGFIDELRSRHAMPVVSGLVLLSAVMVQGLSILFAVGLGLELQGLVWARVLGDLVDFSAAAALCFRFVRARPKLANVKRLLSFGWPFGVVYTLATLRGFDRPLVRSFTSIEHVAAYELAMRLVGPIGLFNIALAVVFEPFVYAHSQSAETPGFVDAFVRNYVALFAAIAMAISLVAPELVAIFAPEPYREASRALPPLLFAATCEGLQRTAGVGADLAKRTGVWAVASSVTLAVGLALMAGLTPRFGIAGAGAAWVVANVASTVLVYRVARQVSGIVLPVGRALGVIVAGAVLATAAAFRPWPIASRVALFLFFALGVHQTMRARWAEMYGLLRRGA